MRIGPALTASEAIAQFVPQVPREAPATPSASGPRRIPLCVPIEQKDVARNAGAKWNKAAKVWECAPSVLTRRYEQLRPFVPLMYRPDEAWPYLVPLMVPSCNWKRNLRSAISEDDWDKVRRQVYRAAGWRCQICGGRGPDHPVEAHEMWSYEDRTGVQRLVTVLALCRDCHRVQHMGLAKVNGEEDLALEQIMRVNCCGMDEAQHITQVAWDEWENREGRQWRIDCSWVERFGVSVDSFWRA